MADNLFAQPPVGEPDLGNWRKNIQESLFGEEGAGGKLNDDNMEEALLTITAVKSALSIDAIVDADGTLADITTKFNTLLASLRTIGILEE